MYFVSENQHLGGCPNIIIPPPYKDSGGGKIVSQNSWEEFRYNSIVDIWDQRL